MLKVVPLMSTMTYSFTLPDLHCSSCINLVERTFKACKSVPGTRVMVALDQKKLTIEVTGDGRPSTDVRGLLQAELRSIDMEYVDLDLDLPAPIAPVSTITPPPASTFFSRFKQFMSSHWFLGILGTVAGLALLTVSLVAGALPMAATIAIAVTSTSLTLVLGAKSYLDAAKRLFKSGTLTMDTLFAISTLTVLAVSIAAFFVPWLPMMFEAGLLIFGFRHIGNAIKDSIEQVAGLRSRFSERLPQTVNVLVDEIHVKKALDDALPGDELLIQPGELIPVDGESMANDSMIIETIVTGSSVPRDVVMGERLLAGMSVAPDGAPLRMRITALAKQSYLARLDATIERANLEKAPLETITNKILQYFIPAVIVLAIISALVIGHFFTIALALKCAIAVLVSACPCTLGLIMPLAVKIGMNKAGAQGVRFKSAKTLQAAGDVDCVVFDLHGTLTIGVPSVRQYGVMPGVGISGPALLAYVAAIEKKYIAAMKEKKKLPHQMATAICDYVDAERIVHPEAWNVTLSPSSNHSGLCAEIDGEHYVLGNADMMKEAQIDLSAVSSMVPSNDGDSVVYLARRGGPMLGYMMLRDELRPHARHVVNSLISRGLMVCLCTGADEATARRYAHMLGILPENTRSGCMGVAARSSDREKKSFITDLKAKGHRVGFIGDGSNDAAAMPFCDFGLAIKSQGGDDITQQQAGAVIQGGSLLPVVSAFAVAKQTVNHIKQSLVFSLAYNIGAMLLSSGLLLAVGVMLNPGIGVLLMIVQTSLILLNAYRVKNQKSEHLESIPNEKGGAPSSYQRITPSMPTLATRLQPAPSLPPEAPSAAIEVSLPIPISQDESWGLSPSM